MSNFRINSDKYPADCCVIFDGSEVISAFNFVVGYLRVMRPVRTFIFEITEKYMYTEQYIIIDRKFNNYDDPFFEFMIENKHCQFRHTIYYEEIIFLLDAFQKKIDYKDYDYNEIMGEEYYSGISIKLDWKDTGAFLTFRCTNTGIREAHKVEIEIFIENDEIKEFIEDFDLFVNEKTNKFIWFDLQ